MIDSTAAPRARAPIACELTPAQFRASRDELLPGLAAVARAVRLLPDGVRLEFCAAAPPLAHVARVIDRERRCCRFLDWTLRVPADGGMIHLDVTGPEGTRALLADMLDGMLTDAPSSD